MIPWFGPETAQAFSYLSLLSLVSVLQVFAHKGRHKTAVTATIAIGAVLGALLVAAASIAAVAGQPRHVVFAFGLAGVVLCVVFGAVLLALRGQYTKAELRRVAARDI